MLAQLVVSGIANGCIYALMALGMTLLYRSTKVVNFAHGALFMMAAFVMLVSEQESGWNLWVLSAAALVALSVAGGLFDVVLMRRLREAPHLSVAMMTVALSFLLTGIAQFFFGTSFGSIQPLLSGPPFSVGGVFITGQNMLIIIASLAIFAVFATIFRRTEAGTMIEAAAESPRGAMLVGFNVLRINTFLWGLCAVLAGVAGVLTASRTLVYPNMGDHMLMAGLAGMTLGGFGSFLGAILGGILIGLAENLVGAYVSTKLVGVTAYIVIFAVLLVKPQGLFGKADYSRV